MVREAKAIRLEKRREENARRIVLAAIARLASEGLEGLTMQKLAADTGYAVGALYRYFAGKDELLLAMQKHVLDGIREDLAAVRAAASARAEAERMSDGDRALLMVLAAIYTYRSVTERRPAEYTLLAVTTADPRPLVDDTSARASEMLPSLLDVLREVSTLLDEAARTGALGAGDATRRAVVVWSALHGVLATRKLARFGVPGLETDALVEELLLGLFTGFGAERAQTEKVWRDAVRIAEETLSVERAGRQ
jgi:AcrR family transcriptional regulator